MMTSPSTIRTPSPARTVRQVVSQQPEQVNEVWCRKIFRHILQALERHHALKLPHAPISPDSIGFDANGDAVLLPPDGTATEPGEAADVQALGAVVHYAITWEPQPLTPLSTQALEGFSESLVGAVNKCIAPDPRERPQSIAELRNLLGIVALGPAIPHAAPEPAFALPVESARPAGIAGFGKWQRWMLICLAAAVLLAAASALWMLLREADGGDNLALTLPEAVAPSHTNATGAPPAGAPSAPAPSPYEPLASAPMPAAPPASATLPPPPAQRAGPVAELPAPAARPQARVAAAEQPARDAQEAPAVTYKLMVKPWGTVYVDGDERGISPPLKHLRLAPGQHTVRVVNPNYRDRVMHIDTGSMRNGRIHVDFGQRSR